MPMFESEYLTFHFSFTFVVLILRTFSASGIYSFIIIKRIAESLLITSL